MSRKDLVKEAFEIIRQDMAYIDKSDLEIYKEIAECDDLHLEEFVNESN